MRFWVEPISSDIGNKQLFSQVSGIAHNPHRQLVESPRFLVSSQDLTSLTEFKYTVNSGQSATSGQIILYLQGGFIAFHPDGFIWFLQCSEWLLYFHSQHVIVIWILVGLYTILFYQVLPLKDYLFQQVL